jgi:hypothetical protein
VGTETERAVYGVRMRKAFSLLCFLALFLASPAQAKGPDRATLTGPGLAHRLVFNGYGSDGKAPLGVLTSEGGFWAQTFGTAAAGVNQGKVLTAKPTGNLGPRYLVVYRVPGPTTPSVILQELYPYASTPVSHMPKQRFWRTRTAPGGWYQFGPTLKAVLIKAGLPASAPASANACPVTKSTLASRRFGSSRLWVTLPPAGVLLVQRNWPDDGMFGTKIGWIPDRDRNLTLTVSGWRLDAPGRMRVLGVFWGRSSTGKGSWASAVAFPAGGRWRVIGRAGPTTVSYIVRVVTDA